MFHRPNRVVVFGMNTRGVAVQVAPSPDRMKPEDMGMYVHTEEYDKAVELLEKIYGWAEGIECGPGIRHQIEKYKKELEHGFPKR